MGKPTGYRILSYGEMIADHPRMDGYAGDPGTVYSIAGAGGFHEQGHHDQGRTHDQGRDLQSSSGEFRVE